PYDLRALLEEHAAHPDAIVAADHGGDTLGPPCLFPARDFPALVALDGDRGARVLLRQHPERVRRVSMPRAALDVDTPEDLARAAHPTQRPT
ncbi:MAG: nucleotidyltransferase family protein, partial [Panacagrimonas sp.]